MFTREESDCVELISSARFCDYSVHLLVDGTSFIQLHITGFVLQHAYRIRLTQDENYDMTEAVVNQVVDAIPQSLIEIEKDVATDDQLKFIERPICNEVVLAEHDVLLQCRVHLNAPASHAEVVVQRSAVAGT